MKWKNRLTNYNFWISIVSAVLLILQALNLKFDIAYISEIATGVLGLLVVIGIINDPTKNTSSVTQTKKEDATDQSTPFEKNENSYAFDEIDFQIIINKITEDLKNKTKQINIKNLLTEQIKNILNETLQTEMINLNKNNLSNAFNEQKDTENYRNEQNVSKNLEKDISEIANNEQNSSEILKNNLDLDLENQMNNNPYLNINLEDTNLDLLNEKIKNQSSNDEVDAESGTQFGTDTITDNQQNLENQIEIDLNTNLEKNQIENHSETEESEQKPICFNIVN